MINRLGLEQIRELLHQVAERQPGLLFDIWERQPRQEGDGPEAMQPHWCSCTRCREMPQFVENLCCRGDADNCFSTHPVCITFSGVARPDCEGVGGGIEVSWGIPILYWFLSLLPSFPLF